MKEYAPAKINLFLDVIRKREDGYHDLGTVFQTIDAGDTVEATLREDGELHLTYNEPQNYPLESDLVFKAAKALKEFAKCNLGADIHLTKVMPLGAGLGGGSADAAATLRLLNRLWNLNLPFETLESIGARLGADVPFLVRGGTAFAEGIGERLTFVEPLDLPEGAALLIATPLDSVPTKDAYAGVPKSGPDRWEQYKAAWKSQVRVALCGEPVAEPVSANDTFVLLVNPDLCFNAFEISVFPTHPLVAEMKQKFIELGADVALMSGSGASVFGIFKTKELAEKAAAALKPISRYQTVTKFWHR
ncbi:4-diphosphocytidyl-2C-methyl-D-erythritol kinase [Fibrobacter succinogenes subsp. succinogenes S85]|uniref:4-diphosphocytidyl-2-C-methyl-D-erythritol kinase n=1 Tax=Fibrobacter succinogenes (strain ATCC 19169 / S85) TaxID=59374 RepID=C9RLK9_FIBSS|nr:4-(cytidine 5'-diphospho)-2-C-methyl-D-erythritol kinase [Fibrobacter succinogenes]ACX76024.1 4-diphosphocytidyl-2C-methyl-D-erythritol kinase [Fibrobacter succinogenes subsp. succinogenes S85]ADL25354.1 4-diphosphocytidyl-2C-methyl-D-erythritol kinase [Fibrobacter succinogenes subsp. succinogenes S85]